MKHFHFLFLCTCIWALNGTHEARYTLFPQPWEKHRTEFGVGALTHFDSDFNIPLWAIFGVNNSFEIGTRINLDSRGQKFSFEKAHVQGDLGITLHLRNGDLVQADLLFGIGSGGGEGVNVSYTTWEGLSKKLKAALQLQFSFFSGLVGDQVTVVEAGFYPTYRLTNQFDLITSLTYSTGFPSLKEWGAFDLAPGLRYRMNSSELLFLAYFGVAGPHSEGDILYKLGWSNDF